MVTNVPKLLHMHLKRSLGNIPHEQSLRMLQLHSVFDCEEGPIDFSSGLITVCEGKVHKRISSVYKSRRNYQDHSNHSFHCLIPCSIALHLFLVRLLLNTRLYKVIGACTMLTCKGGMRDEHVP